MIGEFPYLAPVSIRPDENNDLSHDQGSFHVEIHRDAVLDQCFQDSPLVSYGHEAAAVLVSGKVFNRFVIIYGKHRR
jgi:hypothetical protein